MTNVPYVVLSRQVSLLRELDSIANNVSNSQTTGYRKDEYIFSEYVNAIQNEPSISQSRVGGRSINTEQGEAVKTGGALDVMIDGRGFFAVITPAGQRLTRAGSFVLTEQGEIATPVGHLLTDSGGSPLTIPSGAKSIVISPDGNVSADGTALGQIAIFDVPAISLDREGDSLFRATVDATPVENPRMRQGFIEGSNVNPVLELSRMIEVQRAFELDQQIMNEDAQRSQRAVQILSGAQ